ncbi:CPBP family intramembrane glutamic endopeptidase [Nocardia sp. NPDC024068]|uniref:CPBP family intramembrane glutamic endopeptidase n=1 Tax=Nocardia sp. NPDC024068 TaxID=3157197 RepID=UPI003401B59A
MRARVLVAVAAPLLWSNWLLPRAGMGRRGRTVANTLAATGYTLVLGGRPNWVSGSGLRAGIGCAALVAAGYTVAAYLPPVRRVLGDSGDRAADVSTAEWVAVHIPLGTVYTEELIFRATLDPLLDTEFGSRVGTVAGAAAFGLWHIHPARAAGDSVAVTVAFTGASGLLFGALARYSGSVTAPALLHWAVNAGGALLARKTLGRAGVGSSPRHRPGAPAVFAGRGRADGDTLRR